MVSEVIKTIGLVNILFFSGIVLITEIGIAIAIVSALFFVEPVGTLFIIVFFFLFGSTYYFLSKKKLSAWGEIRQFTDKDISKLITEGLNGINA